jgi:hypothetical protein
VNALAPGARRATFRPPSSHSTTAVPSAATRAIGFLASVIGVETMAGAPNVVPVRTAAWTVVLMPVPSIHARTATPCPPVANAVCAVVAGVVSSGARPVKVALPAARAAPSWTTLGRDLRAEAVGAGQVDGVRGGGRGGDEEQGDGGGERSHLSTSVLVKVVVLPPAVSVISSL